MRHDHLIVRAWLRRASLAAVGVAGLVAIVGSGGGAGDPPQCSFFSNVCNPNVTASFATPWVSIYPVKLTVRAGESATIAAGALGVDQARLQWQRSADGGVTYSDIAGATALKYTLPAAQFADDGAVFRLEARSSGGNTVLASSNAATLLVSSRPPVVFEDGEFQTTDWSASAIAEPAQNGPGHTEDRSAAGGLPGAFRHMVHTMTAGPSSLRVFNTKASAVYEPQVQGAVLAIDYREDCSRLSASSTAFDVRSYPTFEQAGRRYVSKQGRGCLSLWVGNFDNFPSLQASDFAQVDGPACGGGESCPDFSAGGSPLRLGFERRVSLQAGVAAGSIEHGIDNWKFSVWQP